MRGLCAVPILKGRFEDMRNSWRSSGRSRAVFSMARHGTGRGRHARSRGASRRPTGQPEEKKRKGGALLAGGVAYRCECVGADGGRLTVKLPLDSPSTLHADAMTLPSNEMVPSDACAVVEIAAPAAITRRGKAPAFFLISIFKSSQEFTLESASLRLKNQSCVSE
ncbi:hypothetical protein [Burkholderia ubonensis]|uniref:hypothetical protein n=1 Tax=Burkholderia ubonensis TaxID=101571 RepID=UPI0012FC784A|nr:hypothetical protein [Burkholderia ubonensis]